MIKKLALGLLIVSGIATISSVTYAAKSKVNFTHPPEENVVFTKNEVEIISGTILSNEELQYAEISFDGLIWRDLPIIESTDGYNFSYEWTVAGKGRFFIIVNAYTTKGDLIDGRILSEVYVPPELEEEGLKSMLANYQKEQEAKQAKEKAAQEKKNPTTFMSFESFVEGTLGNFLEDEWMALLPTKKQIEFFMNTTVYIYNFINTYQAGIDIFFVLTIPLMVALIMMAFLFIYLDHLLCFFEYLFFLTKKTNVGETDYGLLFDNYDLYPVEFAKIELRNTDTGAKYILVSNKDGYVSFSNLPEGEYNYEVSKQGYKPHILDDTNIDTYQDCLVAKNNTLKLTSGTNMALPVEALVSKERKVANEKASIFYRPKVWFLNSMTTWLSIGCLIMMLYMIFINMYYPIIVVVYLVLAYVIYSVIIKTKCPWGVISFVDHTRATNEKVQLISNGEIFTSTWSDFEGKFEFKGIKKGVFRILPDVKYSLLSKERYYDGSEFEVGKDRCMMKKNMVVEEKSTN